MYCVDVQKYQLHNEQKYLSTSNSMLLLRESIKKKKKPCLEYVNYKNSIPF